jgi:hypothetical protein
MQQGSDRRTRITLVLRQQGIDLSLQSPRFRRIHCLSQKRTKIERLKVAVKPILSSLCLRGWALPC